MMNLQELLANRGEKPDASWVMTMLAKHPAFVMPAALLLARCPEAVDDATRRQLQARVMLAAPDRAAMADFADLAGLDWSQFYPKPVDTRQKSTEETIDTFLDTYCKESSSEAENALLERLIFNPVAADYLQAEEAGIVAAASEGASEGASPTTESTESKESLIAPVSASDYLQAQEAGHVPPPPAADEAEPQLPADAKIEAGGDADAPEANPEEPLLMESLAKIFIKQRRYERAFEIINNLSLKNPEKSAYFADQLRFLRKLIIIQQSKANSKAAEARKS